jgi:hypothetical protein
MCSMTQHADTGVMRCAGTVIVLIVLSMIQSQLWCLHQERAFGLG